MRFLITGGLGFIGYLSLMSEILYDGMGPTIANAIVGILSAIVDILLPGANYAFLVEPPDADNPFFSAPWPWYLLVIDIMSVVMFALAYLPFHFMDKWKARNSAENSAE